MTMMPRQGSESIGGLKRERERKRKSKYPYVCCVEASERDLRACLHMYYSK
jgi:hypothetical protein